VGTGVLSSLDGEGSSDAALAKLGRGCVARRNFYCASRGVQEEVEEQQLFQQLFEQLFNVRFCQKRTSLPKYLARCRRHSGMNMS
jgi:hypothetical protein